MAESMSLSDFELDDNDVDELEVETVDDGRSTTNYSNFAVSSQLLCQPSFHKLVKKMERLYWQTCFRRSKSHLLKIIIQPSLFFFMSEYFWSSILESIIGGIKA